jgi:hypothetical protein
VFLQSDVLDAVAAMRDEYEQHASDVLQLSPLHTTAPVFHWTREQEYAALAAAAAAAADAQAVENQQEQQQQQDGAGEVQQAADSLHIPLAAAGIDGVNSSNSGEDTNNSSRAAGEAEVGSIEEANSSEGFVSTWAEAGWLVDNPLGVPTERENYVQNQGGKVFRVLLVKKQ